MLRLSPPGHRRLVQAEQFEAVFGGAEANVAVSLAHYGCESYFVSKLPEHALGQSCLNQLRRYGVHPDYVERGPGRLGVYFLETGASQRGSKVVYDRAGSTINDLDPEDVDWDAIFDGADWFHWTGITPALGEGPRRVLEVACGAAQAAGVTVSCDVNYRAKLWTLAEARAAMRPLMEYVDVCIANGGHADRALDVRVDSADPETGYLDEEGCYRLAEKLKREMDFQAVALTMRESFSASVNGWSAVLHDDADCATPYRSARYEITLVDRVGGGDAFAGGLIYGLLAKDDTRAAIEFAAAAGCLKQTIPGDFNLATVEEVEALAAGPGSGQVER